MIGSRMMFKIWKSGMSMDVSPKKQVSYSLIASWTWLERLQVFRLGIKLRSSPVPLTICSMAHRPKGAHIDRNSNRNREKVTAAVTPTHPNCQNLFWWYTYPWKIWRSVGMVILNIYIEKNKFQTTNQCFFLCQASCWGTNAALSFRTRPAPMGP